MAPSPTVPRNHQANLPQKLLSSVYEPSSVYQPFSIFNPFPNFNPFDSRQFSKQPSTVIGSRISKHRDTTARDHKSKTGDNRSRVAKAHKHTKPTTTQGIITVHLNNRLGRRTSIQCFPHDTIKTLKILASAQLGMRPNTIMLKRQGQRALKDGLTLEDYEIGNGCEVGLEVDTES